TARSSSTVRGWTSNSAGPPIFRCVNGASGALRLVIAGKSSARDMEHSLRAYYSKYDLATLENMPPAVALSLRLRVYDHSRSVTQEPLHGLRGHLFEGAVLDRPVLAHRTPLTRAVDVLRLGEHPAAIGQ